MKKHIIRSLSVVLALLLLAPCFAACDTTPKMENMTEAERTDKIFDIIGDNFADSYTMDQKIEMEGSYAGSSFSLTTNDFTTYTGLRSESTQKHAESSMEMLVHTGDTKVTSKIEAAAGYRDGKMYISYKDDDKNAALVSPISIEDYDKHLKFIYNGISDDLITEALKKAASKTCVQLEDGSWSATASGYDEEALAIILESIDSSITSMCDGYKYSDVSVNIIVTEELVPVSMEFAFSFERTDFDDLYRTPKLKMTSTIRDIDTAVLPEVDFSKYTEVEDLAAFLEVRKVLGDLKLADSVKFTSVIEQNIKVAGTNQDFKETDKVTSSTDEEGKYSFSIHSKIDYGTGSETDVTITYKDGSMTTKVPDFGSQSQEITDSAAKIYLGTLLDPLSLTSVYPSEIKEGEGDYTHTFVISSPDLSAFETLYGQLGATTNIKGSAEVFVVYKNGTVTAMKCNLTVTAKIEGQTLTQKITYIITIEE